MARSFSRVAIVNRGEAALRFINAARELSREGEHLRTIALFSDPDRHALFVREADESYALGPAMVEAAQGRRQVAYLDLPRLERALRETRAEAVWPGWGFVAELPAFAELCERLGIVFVGPAPAAMRALGDKAAAKRLAQSLGLPVVPWAGVAASTLAQAEAQAQALGFPLVVKPAAGNGGRGVREAETAQELPAAWDGARAEAEKTLDGGLVLLERRLDGARQIDVQVVADTWGGVWALPPREASVQRRHQKLIEEAPATVVSAEHEARLREAAARLVRAAGCVGAVAVEFLYDPAAGDYWFLEANTRLEVEHAVSEAVCSIDLVKLQLHVARGGRLPGEAPPASGHAIEVRLCAEDAEAGFAPAPGRVARLRLPGGPGLRVDVGVAEGDPVPVEFDSMIAKLIAHGRDREEALARLARGLAQTDVVLRGGTTNKAFLLDLLDREELRSGRVDVRFLDRLLARGEQTSRRHAEVALVRAAIEAYEVEADREKVRFLSTALRGRPEVRPETQRRVELRRGAESYQVNVRRLGVDRYRVEEGGQRVEVAIERLGAPLRERRLQTSEWRLYCGGASHRALSLVQERRHLVEVDGVPHAFTREAAGLVVAPAPAIVVSVAVRPGDEVEAGRPLLVLEAMKMETALAAPFAGHVREVRVVPNVHVGPGDPLLLLDPEPRRPAAPSGKRLHLDVLGAGAAASGPPAGSQLALEELRALMLGFDVEAAGLREALARPDGPADAAFARSAGAALDSFADVCSLFRRRGEGEGTPEEATSSGSEEFLFSYLRKLDERGAGLPEAFLAKLRRALRHYGVDDLARSPELEESLYRLCKAHQREDQLAGPVSTLLERLLEADAGALAAVAELPALLDRLIAATQSRHPALNDLARELRFRRLERPLLERVRAEAFDRAAQDLAALAGALPPVGRQERVEGLVQCPQPLAGWLVERWGGANPPARSAILEVLLRRFYRIRELGPVEALQLDGHRFAAASYRHEGGELRALVTHAGEAGLRSALQALGRLSADQPPTTELMADLFLWRAAGIGDADANAAEIHAQLREAPLPRPFRRVVVAIAAAGAMQHFTFRPSSGGYVEEAFFRDAHPMMAKRLQLDRLQQFDLERLPSVEDVYLIRAVAKGNPRDERLFVMAEVRDLTPIRDGEQRVVQLPQLERMLIEAVGAVRAVQARRPAGQRLQGNQIMLQVWPALAIADEDLHALVRRYAPITEGLGLEGVTILGRALDADGTPRESAIFLAKPAGRPIVVRRGEPDSGPIAPLSAYEQKVVRLAQRGFVYPYELVRLLAPPNAAAGGPFPRGDFTEHELDTEGRLQPVERPFGENQANVIVGVIRNYSERHPEGMARVLLLGDPSRELGSLAEPECRRIAAALDLARELRVPVDWLALSAGAKISTDSGTENMDWIALVLRKVVEFTQGGGEINVVVNGINVGAQPYWNAEATMLMHTRGILVMMPDSAMVLTGKRALDFSGGVSAEDNQGIGGYERVMGPNGQAQYFARDIGEACRILFSHHEHTYVAPGEDTPRRAASSDPVERDVCRFPYPASAEHGFETVGDVLTDAGNPGRKKPFEVRTVMAAVADQDLPPLERWAAWRDGETVVVWDAHLGGWPVCLLGIESRPLPRLGVPPADGPEQWTGGTLFPQSSRKAARAINAASDNRPLVVLANLTGFDGSPESLRQWQLEYGAEIGRAVVNFRGPIVFCVISRYHGGAFVVFSKALHDNFRVLALEGTYASVIGGAPAAAVVFAREVEKRAAADPRIEALEQALAAASGAEKSRLRAVLRETMREVHSQMLGRVADEYDAIHSVARAQRVGSIDEIIPAARLRPHLIAAIEAGLQRQRAQVAAGRV